MVEKDAYVQKLHAKIDEWNAEIDKLKAKGDLVKAEKRAEYEKELEALRAKRIELKEKASQLGGAGENAWKDLKAGVDGALKSLESALNAAKSRFR
jgi:hypothetical protein